MRKHQNQNKATQTNTKESISAVCNFFQRRNQDFEPASTFFSPHSIVGFLFSSLRPAAVLRRPPPAALPNITHSTLHTHSHTPNITYPTPHTSTTWHHTPNPTSDTQHYTLDITHTGHHKHATSHSVSHISVHVARGRTFFFDLQARATSKIAVADLSDSENR